MSNSSQSNVKNSHLEVNDFKNRGKLFLMIGTFLLGLAFVIPPTLIFLSNFLPEFDEILFSTFYLVLILGIFGFGLILIGSYYYNKAELEDI